MTITVGAQIPAATLKHMTKDGPSNITTDELFRGKTVVLFSVPGAFTPTCHAKHLPGFVQHAAELKAKGVDTIACLAVNDVFVMAAWGKASGVDDSILMLADGNAEFTKALGLELDATGFGMGIRGKRFALVARDGVVYDGVGYDPAMLRTLPWLDGVKLLREGSGFARIDGMETAADLLSRAKFEAEPRYSTWRVVSLARFKEDGDIAVRTADGLTIIFGTREDFFRQLARLDLLLDTAAKAPAGQPAVREINLSLGSQVPVAFAAAQAEPSVRAAAPAAPAFPQLHIKITP